MRGGPSGRTSPPFALAVSCVFRHPVASLDPFTVKFLSSFRRYGLPGLTWVASLLASLPPAALAQVPATQTNGSAATAWQETKAVSVGSFQVGLSKPILVSRSRGYLWFPTLVRLSSGDCMAVMSNYADKHVAVSTSLASWSHDAGVTWTKPIEAQYGDVSLRRAGDDELLLPYYLHSQADGSLGAPFQICPKRKQELRLVKEGVTIQGLPRKDKSFAPELGLGGLVFSGQSVRLKNGGYLATMYGFFEGATRFNLVAVESPDGVKWTWKSTVADENCLLPGKEGPCEAALCRLADGRLMSVFRMNPTEPFGQAWSDDEGKSWSAAVQMKGPFSVQPSLAVMKDGTVALSGGRPGIFLWLNADKTGKEWQKLDLVAHHNEQRPEDAIKEAGQTSAYTEVIALDDQHLLVIYDRIPSGWNPIPESSTETNSVWVVRIKVQPAKASGT